MDFGEGRRRVRGSGDFQNMALGGVRIQVTGNSKHGVRIKAIGLWRGKAKVKKKNELRMRASKRRRQVCNLGLWFPDIRKDDVPREVP